MTPTGTFPIIKLKDALIAVDREAEIKEGDIIPLDYGGFVTVMENESNFYNKRKSRYSPIIAASPSLGLDVVELPEVWKEQLLTYPESVEIEAGRFRKYNY